jgi:putative FmdB family regulatory protein
MPTYDYVCDRCEHRFEAFQAMSAKPLRKCPKCGRMSLRRLIGTGGGIIFRGSGFYATDYRSKPAASTDGKAKEGESKGKEEKGSEGPSKGDKTCGPCGRTGPDVCDG